MKIVLNASSNPSDDLSIIKGETTINVMSKITTLETSTLPSVTSSDNGKILMVVEGVWTLVSPSTIYSGSGEPSNAQGNNGDVYVQTS